MGVKDSFMGASIVAKIALLVLLVATLFSWIAFTTSGWAVLNTTPDTYYGIWRSCADAVAGCNQLDGAGRSWVAAFQAFSIFGFLGVNVAFALVLAFIFMDKCKGDKEASIAACIAGIVGAVCWLIAVIIFVAEYKDELGSGVELEYDFGLTIVAMILSAVGGVAMIFAQGGAATKPSG